MNKVILMGRLTRDPELRYTTSAEPLAVTRFTLAVDRPLSKNADQNVDFINVSALGKRAETIANYVKKGQMLSIVGRLQVRNYDDPKSGEKRTFTEVLVEEFHFTGSKSTGQASENTFDPTPKAPRTPNMPQVKPSDVEGFLQLDEDDEDLPF